MGFNSAFKGVMRRYNYQLNIIVSSFTIVDMSTFLPAALLMADAVLPRGLNDFRRVRKTAKGLLASS